MTSLSGKQMIFILAAVAACGLVACVVCVPRYMGEVAREEALANGVQRREQAVRWVEANGGSVRYFQDESTPAREVAEVTITKTISRLAAFRRLRVLDVSLSKVHDLAVLRSHKELEYLRLGGTPVSDISALKGLTRLSHLELSDTAVRDLSPLRDLKSLCYLDLAATNVDDLSPLYCLPNLRILNLDRASIDVARVEEFRRAVPNCGTLKTLRLLELDDSQISEDGLRQLRQLLSNCEIKLWGLRESPLGSIHE